MDNKKAIKNMLKHIDKILFYTKDSNYSNFASDMKLQDACLMNLSQIGESVADIDNGFIEGHNEIIWKEIKGMRNIIVHDYDGINMRIVWETIKFNLPDLKVKLERLISDK